MTETSAAAARGGWLIRGLWVIGLAVSAYLSYEHVTGSKSLACSDSGVVDCAAVTTSAWAYLFGVPVALLGLGYFVVGNGFAWVVAPRWPLHRQRLVGAALTGVGLLFVLYLVYGEIVLGRICSWCTVVHVVTFVLFTAYFSSWFVNRD